MAGIWREFFKEGPDNLGDLAGILGEKWENFKEGPNKLGSLAGTWGSFLKKGPLNNLGNLAGFFRGQNGKILQKGPTSWESWREFLGKCLGLKKGPKVSRNLFNGNSGQFCLNGGLSPKYLVQLTPFGPSPHFAKPPFGFPRLSFPFACQDSGDCVPDLFRNFLFRSPEQTE